MELRERAAALAALLGLASCGSTGTAEWTRSLPTASQFPVAGDPLVQDGKTMREELLLALGEPDAAASDGRVLAYLARTGDSTILGLSTGAKPSDRRSLLLVEFDDSGTLRRHLLRSTSVSDPEDWEYALYESWIAESRR